MIISYLDDIKPGGRHVSRGRTITETGLVSFAMFRDDRTGVVTSRFAVRNQRDEDVLVASLKLLVAGRPS